jgi:hypothetical protein
MADELQDYSDQLKKMSCDDLSKEKYNLQQVGITSRFSQDGLKTHQAKLDLVSKAITDCKKIKESPVDTKKIDPVTPAKNTDKRNLWIALGLAIAATVAVIALYPKNK